MHQKSAEGFLQSTATTCTVPGKIIVLNGAPRSGKSSIAYVIQKTFDGVWMNLGVDQFMRMTPEVCIMQCMKALLHIAA